MALSKIFKKNSAPEELPDLAIDELKKELKGVSEEKIEEPVEKEEPETKVETSEIEEIKTEEDNSEKIEEPVEKEEPEEENNEAVAENKNMDKSFFNPLIAELKKENFDPAKINRWYQENFSHKSAVDGMKDYWEKKKEDFITETVEKEFRARINERVNHLQELEAAWQEVYVKLLEKEEEMKKEELNIKKLIKDFSEVGIKKRNGKSVKKHKKAAANHEKK